MYRKIEESQTLLINTQSKDLEIQGKKIIKFGFGQSPFLPPTAVVDELRKSAHRKEYSSVQGDLELRQLMSRFHEDHNGLKVSASNIFIAPGSKILIFNTLMAFEKADVFIATPSWVSYAPQAKLAGHHVIRMNTSYKERWRITSKTIINAVKNKKHRESIIILNYPGNPDGLTYTHAELNEIANVAKELNILVISDEIYGLLDYKESHKSFACYYPEKTITTTGMSKWCGAGGWRFGALFLYEDIEPDFKQALLGIGSETYSCAPMPVQMAAKKAYHNFHEMKAYLSWQINILKLIGNYCANKLNANGIRTHSPEGGFYLLPDFTNHWERLHCQGIKTSNELCRRILKETGVALLPASVFGFEEHYLAARLAFVDFQEMDSFDLKVNCPNVIEGIDLMCDWVSKL